MFTHDCDQDIGIAPLPKEVCILSNGELSISLSTEGRAFDNTSHESLRNPLDEFNWEDLYVAWGLPIVGKDLKFAEWHPSQPLIIEILGRDGKVIETRYA